MDKLSSFLVSNFRSTLPTAAPAEVPLPELTEQEKRAYGIASLGACDDENFLSQFEGSPLYPQAIALAEQELAMKQRHLQQRMQRAAQERLNDYSQECNESEALQLQKQQLALELHKSKAMGVGAPTPPGQAVIGTPDPAAAMAAPAPEPEAPVEPKVAGIATSLGNLVERGAHHLGALTGSASNAFARGVGSRAADVGASAAHAGGEFVRGAVNEAGTQLKNLGHSAINAVKANPAKAIGAGALGVGAVAAPPAMIAAQIHGSNQRQERMASALEALAAQKTAGLATMIQPAAKMTAQELGATLRLQHQARGAQQVAKALGHAPAPAGANPFGLAAKPAVPAPPAWLMGKAAALEHVRKMKTKCAGLADREYMRAGANTVNEYVRPSAESLGSKAKNLLSLEGSHMENAVRFGLPAVNGAIIGAEQNPQAPVLGALGGGTGAVGGSELGAYMLGNAASSFAPAEYREIARAVGRAGGHYVGMGAGASLGSRAVGALTR